MKLFMVAAMGAVLMAGCAPFEHGHYAEDVAYRNTAGDPPGTPLVYLGEKSGTSSFSSSSYASANTGNHWNNNRRYGNHRHGSGYTAYGNVGSVPTQSFSQPVTYTQQATYQQPVSYDQTASYTAPVQQSYGLQTAYTQPLQQSFVQQATYVQPAAQSTYTAATSYSGVRFDSEGYAICEIPHAGHAAQHSALYQPRF